MEIFFSGVTETKCWRPPIIVGVCDRDTATLVDQAPESLPSRKAIVLHSAESLADYKVLVLLVVSKLKSAAIVLLDDFVNQIDVV